MTQENNLFEGIDNALIEFQQQILELVLKTIDEQIQYQIDRQNATNGTMPMYIVAVHREDELCILKHRLQKLLYE